MPREQRALVLAGICVVLTVLGGFVLSWVRIADGVTVSEIDLRGVTVCAIPGAVAAAPAAAPAPGTPTISDVLPDAPSTADATAAAAAKVPRVGCQRNGLGDTGLFGDNAAITLWGSVLFALFVVLLVGGRLLRGYPAAKSIKKAYFWGVTICGTVLTTAYVFEPDRPPGASLHHGAGALVLAIGQIAGLVGIYYANDGSYDDDVGEYKPVVISKPAPKPLAPPPA